MYLLDNTEKKIIPNKIKSVIIVASAVVALVAAVILFVCFTGRSKPENSSIVVYKTSGAIGVRIDDLETTVSDSTAINFKCDTENNRVFYMVESSYSDGLYDLYYIEKKRSEITEPKIVDIGIGVLPKRRGSQVRRRRIHKESVLWAR